MSTNVHLVKAMVFPVVMYACESWTIKKAEHWRIDASELVLERTLESPLDCKEIQLVHPKGDQSWVFIGGTDVEAETPVLWPLDENNWLIWKDPNVGKDWGPDTFLSSLWPAGMKGPDSSLTGRTFYMFWCHTSFFIEYSDWIVSCYITSYLVPVLKLSHFYDVLSWS